MKHLASWSKWLSQWQWRPLDASVVGDARHIATFEFVSLKQRPMTSRAVCYGIKLAVTVAKTFMPGLASQILQLYIQTTCLTQGFSVKIIVMRQKVHRHTFIQVDLWPFIFPRLRQQWLGLSKWQRLRFKVFKICFIPLYIAVSTTIMIIILLSVLWRWC